MEKMIFSQRVFAKQPAPVYNKATKQKEADAMFQIKHITGNTYYFECLSNIGIYKLSETDVCLIDSGDDFSTGKRLIKRLEEKGWSVKAIVNTHSHTDHIYNNKRLTDKYGCRSYIGANDITFAADYKLDASFVSSSNPPKELMTRYMVHEAFKAEDYSKADLPLEYIPLPGHTGYMTGIKTPDNVFFVGDCVVDPGLFKKTKISYIYDIGQYLESIDKALSVNAKFYVPSHSVPTEDFAPIAQANKDTVNEIANLVYEICRTPKTPEEVTTAAADALGYKMGYSQYCLALSTLKSYLTYLQENNKAKTYIENNRVYWLSV